LSNVIDESYCKILEGSLIKNANNIKYLSMNWKPVTNILSCLINLISLDLNLSNYTDWSCLEKASLPNLKILKTKEIPSRIVASLIQNTGGHLINVSIYHEGVDNKRLIQEIYQNCPNLMYLKISFNNDDISELEKLLVECQYLNGLVIITLDNDEPDWDNLFELLTRSSPTSLFKFKFSYYYSTLRLESLRSFFDNWNDRHPILLQTIPYYYLFTNMKQQLQQLQMNNLINEYITKRNS